MTCTIDTCDSPAQARGWCSKHYARWRRKGNPTDVELIVGNDDARFWAKVTKTATCWLWTGELTRDGYGRFWVNGRTVAAHRWAYERFVAPIPDGKQLDHVAARGCTNRNCVRPVHLEPVECRENLHRGQTVNALNAAKTHCHLGHPFDDENTYVSPQGERGCRICRSEAKRRFRARRSGAPA